MTTSLEERRERTERLLPRYSCLPKLRPYQEDPWVAIRRSVDERCGLSFTLMMARQAGKNEMSAQMELYLLLKNAMQQQPLDGIKCAPTFAPQGYVSMRRLRDRIIQIGLAKSVRQEAGRILRLGLARQIFLSADESSHVAGHTAAMLLEVDEAQDVSREKFDREFRPMASSTGATTVYYGTPWDDGTLLAEAVERNRELERRDGIQRHFEADWTVVAEANPEYGRFVLGERERLGENHPLFRTQYALRTISGGGRLFDGGQRAQIQGRHARQHAPHTGEVYVAGLDVGGQALDGSGGRHDATVLTIGRLIEAQSSAVVQEPRLEVVEHTTFQGTAHDEVLARVADIAGRVWGVRRLAVDATGLGETLARLLGRALGEDVVRPLRFTVESKSRLGYGLLAAVNGGRLRMYAADGSPEYAACWAELEAARAVYRPNQAMNFFVDPTQGHDDYLVSMALAVEAGRDAETRPRVARGRLQPLGALN